MQLKRKDWDVNAITHQIYKMGRECSSPYNDGYTAFDIKKDLYVLKELIDQQLKDSPKFSGEEEWLTDREKKRILKALKS